MCSIITVNLSHVGSLFYVIMHLDTLPYLLFTDHFLIIKSCGLCVHCQGFNINFPSNLLVPDYLVIGYLNLAPVLYEYVIQSSVIRSSYK